MCLADQVKIFLIEKGVFSVALLSLALLSLATTFTVLVILLLFIYDETLADLALLLERWFR